MVRVKGVQDGSIAEELGIVPGTELVSVNGRELADFLDWEFLTADDELVIEARLPDGEAIVYEIERPEGESLGVELEPPTIRRCANRCEFCFIEGLPKGLRKPLYVRDDDYRLSFAYGNFATLSNVKERDIARIVEQLTMLAAGGIQFHAQMVIVPGLNDGAVLEQSFADLWALGDAVLSVAIVPVGLTQFSHLYTGKSMDREKSNELLTTVDRWAARAREERDHNWVYGSDELYLLAERPLPDADFYGDFPQIENGVGAVTSLRSRVHEGLDSLPRLDGRRIGVVTGVSMAPLMPEVLDQISGKTGAHFELIVMENSLFGPTTTTAGLLVGADIRRALADRHDLDLALIPAECINDNGVFLDDEPFIALREEMNMPVYPSYDFIDVLVQEPAEAAA